MGPRAGLDGCGKDSFLQPPGFEPQTVLPVASRYTDCAIPGPLSWKQFFFLGYLPLPWRGLWGSFTPAHCVINTAYQEKGKAQSEPTVVSAPAFHILCEAQECCIPDSVTFSLKKRAIIQYS